MATFVLVDGAFAGVWYMRPLGSCLQAAGHKVYRPTLTGFGERVHLASRAIDLTTHIQDIVHVLYSEWCVEEPEQQRWHAPLSDGPGFGNRSTSA